MGDDDTGLSVKRVFAEKRDTEVALVASEVGLGQVSIAGNQIGRFSLAHRGAVKDVAAAGGQALFATAEDVFMVSADGAEQTDFGAAVCVGATEAASFAAGPDGRVAALARGSWRDRGTVADPRRFDGRYLATGEGAFRVTGDGLEALGLGAVRDVAAGGPYAATGDGLQCHVDGTWERVYEGEVRRVATGENHAHLVSGEGRLLARTVDGWRGCALPVVEPPADVGYGKRPYAVTVAGTVLVDADPAETPDGSGGWRHRALGLGGVAAIAVP